MRHSWKAWCLVLLVKVLFSMIWGVVGIGFADWWAGWMDMLFHFYLQIWMGLVFNWLQLIPIVIMVVSCSCYYDYCYLRKLGKFTYNGMVMDVEDSAIETKILNLIYFSPYF